MANDKIVSIGLDCGTMNLVCARSDSDKIRNMRNVFLELDPEEITVSELSNVSFVENKEDNKLFIIGQDAFTFANIFSHEVSRPMESGLISPKEIYAIDVLTLMIKDLIGEVKNKEVYCSYSVPAQAIDAERSVTYHEKVFGRILSAIGVNHTPINEAMARYDYGQNADYNRAANYLGILQGQQGGTVTKQEPYFDNSGSQNIGLPLAAAAAAYFMSSRDYKENMHTMDVDKMLELVQEITVTEYDYKPEYGGQSFIGMIAEDTPDAFTTPDKKAVNLVNVIGALIGANQALVKRIKALEGVH